MGTVYRIHSGLHIITEFSAYIEEYMQIHSDHPREQFEKMMATVV